MMLWSQVVDQISHDGKIVVATDLATLPGFPTLVVRKLARDSDIEIARPVLRSSLGLTERDLVEIAPRRPTLISTPSRVAPNCRRRSPTYDPPVTFVLVRHCSE
jgi:hypothetical protein